MHFGISFGMNIRHQCKVPTSNGTFEYSFTLFFVPDVFSLITSAEIRKLRTEQPENLATLCYKATERLVKAVDNSSRTVTDQQAVLNSVRLLTRTIPYIFEDPEWKDFFWSSLPGNEKEDSTPLAQSLINAICVSYSS